jgi:hypothetical protein
VGESEQTKRLQDWGTASISKNAALRELTVMSRRIDALAQPAKGEDGFGEPPDFIRGQNHALKVVAGMIGGVMPTYNNISKCISALLNADALLAFRASGPQIRWPLHSEVAQAIADDNAAHPERVPRDALHALVCYGVIRKLIESKGSEGGKHP